MKTLRLKKEVVATLSSGQLHNVYGGGSILDNDTFESRCQCGSLRNCPEPPADTYLCGSGNCVSCGCATYDGCTYTCAETNVTCAVVEPETVGRA